MQIAVFLGARPGKDPRLAQAARALGQWIGENGHGLVYGGSKSGLMGALAQSALAAGARVTGVEPEFFMEAGLQQEGLSQLIDTRDMAERKSRMIALADAFIIFPGGTGTLEEAAEVTSRLSLGQLYAPCVFYNLDGYYEGLRALFQAMLAQGLADPAQFSRVHFAASLAEIEECV